MFAVVLRDFLPAIRKRTSQNIALILDNASSHGATFCDPKKQVHVFFLPPNCTARHQPMDMGVISFIKKKYKYKMLSLIMELLDERQALREAVKDWKAGTKGAYEGHDPHIVDASEIAADIWESISDDLVRNCWLKADILPTIARQKLNRSVGRADDDKAMNDIEQHLNGIIMSLEELSVAGTNRKPTDNECAEDLEEMANLSRKDFMYWLEFEESEEYDELHQTEALENVENILRCGSNLPMSESNQESADAPCAARTRELSAADVANMMAPLEKFASEMAWSGAGTHLRRAKQLLLRNIRSKSRAMNTRQLLIPELFKEMS